jgi:hypothetical protein
MANIAAQVFGGFFSGLIGGFIGYITDVTIGVVLFAFGEISSWFIVLGVVYAIISFIMGIAEAKVAGLFFSLGIIVSGFFLGDAVTALGGIISLAGLIFSLFKSDSSD